MTFNIDKNGMIEALTKGIGAMLGRSVRASFFKLADRLMRNDEFIKMQNANQQMVLDLLALSIFYNEIISPLKGGMSFFSLTKKSKASHIKIGTHMLTSKFAKGADMCVKRFHSILNENQIPIGLLSFSSLKQFMDNINTTLLVE